MKRPFATATLFALLLLGSASSALASDGANATPGEERPASPQSEAATSGVPPAKFRIASLDSRNGDLPSFRTHFKTPEYKSKKEWEARRNALRQQILAAAGLAPLPARTPLRPQVVRHIDFPEYAIESVLIEPLPGYFLGGNLYLPTAARQKRMPAILLPHGHWKRGRLEDLPSYSVPALALNLAHQGYVVFAYDMVGYNDTRQTPHSIESQQYDLWSFHAMGLQLWNSMRALDYLQSLPQVDPDRIGVTGASGGGSQTIFLAAVDDRVKAVAPVNMVSAYMQGGDPCEEAPGLRLSTSNVEIAAVAAPRPMLIISCTKDWTKHTPKEEFPAIRQIYSLYGREQLVTNAHIDSEHNYNRQSREAAYRFFATYLKPAAPDLTDRAFPVPGDEQMLAFPKGDLPKGTAEMKDIFQAWKIAVRLQIEDQDRQSELREALRTAIAVETEPVVEAAIDGTRITIARQGKSDRVEGYWTPGRGAPVLLIDPNGAEGSMRSEMVKQILQSGRPMLTLDLFKPAVKRVQQRQFDRYFLSYNRTEDAERVQDILTAIAFLRLNSKAKPEIIGIGRAGVLSLFAAAVAPSEVEVLADLNGFAGTDSDFIDRFFVPGIQRAGGLPAAMKLVNRLRAAIPATAPAESAAESEEAGDR